MTPDHIVETLRSDILEGRLPPGTLLQQEALADRFGVSRIPVRDALLRLSRDQLAQLAPNRGARVTRLSVPELAEIFEMRVLLETDCLTRAISRAGLDWDAEIDHALALSSLEASRPGWRHGDWRFHRALYEPSGHTRQIRLIGELRDLCALHLAAYDRLTERTARWLDDHQRITAACQARDAVSAGRQLTAHITGARDHLLPQMG